MSEPDLPSQVPLLELLHSVPFAARYCEETPTSAHFFPVGRYCHDAAHAITKERARADALEAALSDVLEMAQEHADHFAQAFAGYKPERHAHYAKSLATARALLEKKT